MRRQKGTRSEEHWAKWKRVGQRAHQAGFSCPDVLSPGVPAIFACVRSFRASDLSQPFRGKYVFCGDGAVGSFLATQKYTGQ